MPRKLDQKVKGRDRYEESPVFTHFDKTWYQLRSIP